MHTLLPIMQLSACAHRPRLTISTPTTSTQPSCAVSANSGSVASHSRRRCSPPVRSASCRQFRMRHLSQMPWRSASPAPCSATGDAGSSQITSPSEPTRSLSSDSDHPVHHIVGDSSATLVASNGHGNGNGSVISHTGSEVLRSISNGHGNGYGLGELKSNGTRIPAAVPSPASSNISAAPSPAVAAPYTFSRAMYALYLFSRPHTMLGTTLSVISISLLALGAAPPSPLLANTAGIALAQVC